MTLTLCSCSSPFFVPLFFRRCRYFIVMWFLLSCRTIHPSLTTSVPSNAYLFSQYYRFLNVDANVIRIKQIRVIILLVCYTSVTMLSAVPCQNDLVFGLFFVNIFCCQLFYLVLIVLLQHAKRKPPTKLQVI